VMLTPELHPSIIPPPWPRCPALFHSRSSHTRHSCNLEPLA
jgi:hypothetical protein